VDSVGLDGGWRIILLRCDGGTRIRKELAQALLWVCAGLIIVNGLYNHGMGNSHPPDHYEKLSAFTAQVRQLTNHSPMLVWNTHPLISYELGLHEHFIALEY